MYTGTELIATERQRQIEVEGWTAKHDSLQTDGELAKAAACYAVGIPVYREERLFTNGDTRLPHIHMVNLWPWDSYWYKPKNRLSDLVRAGALIAAEIDRILAQRQDDH